MQFSSSEYHVRASAFQNSRFEWNLTAAKLYSMALYGDEIQ